MVKGGFRAVLVDVGFFGENYQLWLGGFLGWGEFRAVLAVGKVVLACGVFVGVIWVIKGGFP